MAATEFAATAGSLAVEVVFCASAHHCDSVVLQLPAGSTLAQAVAASGLVQRHGLTTAGLKVGVWTQLREPDALLRDRDRVEIYRQLQVDPKEARRQRYAQHKATLAARQGAAKGRYKA